MELVLILKRSFTFNNIQIFAQGVLVMYNTIVNKK
jgi:hypothetical protein